MVLILRLGAALRRPLRRQDGSAAVEVALCLPLVTLALVLIAHAAVLGADVVSAQGVAREAARVAAVSDDRVVREAADRAAGGRLAALDLSPPSPGRVMGEQVTVTVRLRSEAFAAFGVSVEIPARATMRVER